MKQLKTYQNSYRLKAKQPFDVIKVKMHLKNIMELNLKELEYTDQDMKDVALTLSDEIKTTVKNEKYDRYRIVVIIIGGEKKMQGVHLHHSFLWDQDRDKYVEHLYETNNFYVQAVVYAVYYD